MLLHKNTEITQLDSILNGPISEKVRMKVTILLESFHMIALRGF